MAKIVKVDIDTKKVVKKVTTAGGQSMTPKQAAQKIEKGGKLTHKGVDVHSVGGDHIRTDPDGKKGNNLVPRKK